MNIEGMESSDGFQAVYQLQGRVVNRFKLTTVADNGKRHENLARITVTIPEPLTRRVNAFRDAFGISVSSIVEHAVAAYLERGHAEELIADLRKRGASRRRK
ncbi:MAG: ribbon-helix-helix protein, CopG family [Candidatus Eremiobacteraeota bacterium]|nr:ribbon-helix-helix protein, CopG family [Candidatus Eremiobacteraeota bacterium]